MAQFKPKKLNIESIHGGQKYAESRTPFLPSDVNEIIETLYGTSEGLRLSLRKASLLIPDDQIINIDLYEKNIIFPYGTIIVLNGERKQLTKTTVKIIDYDSYFIVRFNTNTNKVETALTVDDADEYKNYYLFSVCYNTDGKPLTDLDVAYSLGGDSFKISNLTVRSSYNAVDASTTALMTERAVADALKKAAIENQTDGLAYELNDEGTYSCVGIGDATDTDIIIASKVNGIPVTDISSGAFSNSIITSVIIPDSVTVIGDGAFFDCPSLTSVTLGNSVESIVENAFYYCQKLTNINLPESLIEIGGSAFWNCNNLKNILIPKSVETIGYDAFNGSYNIYCEAESQPEDWYGSWLTGTSKVFWNVKSKNGILIFQETGDSTDAVMSQKAVTDALNNIPTSGGGSSVEIVQETGDSEEKVMSQKATTDALDGKLNKVTTTSDAIRAYTVSADGTTQGVLEISHATSNNRSMICGKAAGGIVKVGDPKAEKDAVNLGFADGRYVQIDTSTGGNRVYGVQPDGTQAIFSAARTNYAWSVPLRGDDFTFTVGEPIEPMHPTTKQFVENGFVAKITLAGGFSRVYGVSADGTNKLYNLSWGTHGDTLAIRGENGVLAVGEPTRDNHATTRKYVDAKCDWQSGFNLNSTEYVIDIETPTFTLVTENGDFNFTFFAQGVYLNSFYLNAGQSITINGIASSPEDSSSNYGYPSAALATISRNDYGNLVITNLVCAIQGYTLKIDGATISVIASKN